MRPGRRGVAIAAWIAAYVIWLAALSAARLSIPDPSGRIRDLRIRHVWRLAASGVRAQAPDADVWFQGALVCLALALPLAVWAIARARDIPGTSDRAPVPRPAAPPDLQGSRASPWAWLALAGAIAVAAAVAMTPSTRTRTFVHATGAMQIPNGFADGAHGWHISRAEAFARRGIFDPPLWIAHHQGGYPIESAPTALTAATLGLAWLSLGQFPIPYAHSLIAVAAFIMPAAAFLWLARRDGWPPGIAAAAAVLHLVIPGADGSGGYRTVATAGRVEDAAAAALVLLFLPLAASAMAGRSRRTMAAAALCAAAAMALNPSAALLVSVVALATGGAQWRRLLVILTAAALMYAPAWLPVVDSLALYRGWVSGYASLGAYAYALLESVTPPVLLLAAAGLAVRRARAGRLPVAPVALASLGISAIATLAGGLPFVEIPRLLAFDRLLLLYLAAIGLHAIVRAAAHQLEAGDRVADAAQVAGIAALAMIFAGPWAMLPEPARGLYAPTMSATAESADFAEALQAGARMAPPATAVLVVGRERQSSSLWAPMLHGGSFYYSNPVWHWRKAAAPSFEIVGDISSRAAVPQLLSSPALQARGIGVVVADRTAWPRYVHTLPTLQHVHAGAHFDAFLVREPSRIVDWAGRLAEIRIEDEKIVARGVITGGPVHVRRNWHPGWRALVNGRAAAVHETPDGFMRVQAQPGDLDLELRYDPWWSWRRSLPHGDAR